jgi:hypothetical protein
VIAEITLADQLRSSVESLSRIFLVILALAIGEACKQFVADKPASERDSHIHWDRIWALLAFMVLVVPFSHGMSRYFFQIYQGVSPPNPYSAFLLVDTFVFTVESVLFFVLSRSLPLVLWRRFYATVGLLLLLDIVWGSFVAYHHAPKVVNWVLINVVAVLFYGPLLLHFRKREPSPTIPRICAAVLILRTVADYWLNFSFYFSPQP